MLNFNQEPKISNNTGFYYRTELDCLIETQHLPMLSVIRCGEVMINNIDATNACLFYSAACKVFAIVSLPSIFCNILLNLVEVCLTVFPQETFIAWLPMAISSISSSEHFCFAFVHCILILKRIAVTHFRV